MARSLKCDICSRYYDDLDESFAVDELANFAPGGRMLQWDICSPTCLRSLGERKSGHLTSTATTEVTTTTREFFNELRWCALTAGVIEVKAGDQDLIEGIREKLTGLVAILATQHLPDDDDPIEDDEG